MFRVAVISWISCTHAFELTENFSLLPGLDDQVIDLGAVSSDASLIVPVELRNPGPDTLTVVALTVAEVRADITPATVEAHLVSLGLRRKKR